MERGEEGGKCSFVVVLQLGNGGLGFGLGGVKEQAMVWDGCGRWNLSEGDVDVVDAGFFSLHC